MGIEELERLVAEGIKSGLKGAELRKWVDGERAKLKAERESQYEAEKEAQEKENKMLRQQLAALEDLKKRKAVEPTLGTDSTAWHIKVEDTANSGCPPHMCTSDLLVHASREGFRNSVEQDRTEPLNERHVGTEESRSEERRFLPEPTKTTESVEAKLKVTRSLLVDGPLPPKLKVKAAAPTGATITYENNTSLSTAAKENGACRRQLSKLQSNTPQRKPQLFVHTGKRRILKVREFPLPKCAHARKSSRGQLTHKKAVVSNRKLCHRKFVRLKVNPLFLVTSSSLLINRKALMRHFVHLRTQRRQFIPGRHCGQERCRGPSLATSGKLGVKARKARCMMTAKPKGRIKVNYEIFLDRLFNMNSLWRRNWKYRKKKTRS